MRQARFTIACPPPSLSLEPDHGPVRSTVPWIKLIRAAHVDRRLNQLRTSHVKCFRIASSSDCIHPSPSDRLLPTSRLRDKVRGTSCGGAASDYPATPFSHLEPLPQPQGFSPAHQVQPLEGSLSQPYQASTDIFITASPSSSLSSPPSSPLFSNYRYRTPPEPTQVSNTTATKQSRPTTDEPARLCKSPTHTPLCRRPPPLQSSTVALNPPIETVPHPLSESAAAGASHHTRAGSSLFSLTFSCASPRSTINLCKIRGSD